MFELVFSFNVKDNKKILCLYNIDFPITPKLFSALSIKMRMST